MHYAFYILHSALCIMRCELLKMSLQVLGKDEKNVGIYSDDEAIP